MDPAAIYRATATDDEIDDLLGQRLVAAIDLAWDRIDDVAIEITPDRRRSWAGAALHEATARETGLDYDSLWRA